MALSSQFTLFAVLVLCLVLAHGHRHGRTAHHLVRRQSPTFCNVFGGNRYPRFDGQCNNRDNEEWGSTFSIQERMAPSAYDDGVESPRTLASSGSALPSARVVSVKCHPPNEARSDVTLMVMQFGQFLDHDISLTPMVTGSDGKPLPCECSDNRPDCIQIPLENDEFFTRRRCLELGRSQGLMAPDMFNSRPVRQQTNSLTAFIDASMVYGNSQDEADHLRGEEGLLRDSRLGPRKFLPRGESDACITESNEFCFLAGDERVNEQPGLGAIHTIFMREHNRIASVFKSQFDYDDNRAFFEARKILGAMMQRIVYGEFLPVVLGPAHMTDFGLELSNHTYDATLNPNVLNSFTTAAMRFGHTLIPESFQLEAGELPLKDFFDSPCAVLFQFNDLTSSLLNHNSLAGDRNFAHAVTRHLFEEGEEGMGFDLVAFNIQRGRDHGLAPYNEYRRRCNLRPLTSLTELFPNDPVAVSAYESVEDVDLFTGAMAEPRVNGGLVGPTFACILAKQFQKLKSGDRYFYLNKFTRTGFSQDQIRQINKVSLSKVICQNTEYRRIQRNVFLPVDRSSNPQEDCEDLPEMVFLPWRL